MINNKIITIGVFVSSLLIALIYTAMVSPSANNLLSVLFLITLLYISFASVVYFIFSSFTQAKGALGVSLVIALVLPITILLISLRQFGFFEIFLVAITIVLITWYKLIKNNKQ